MCQQPKTRGGESSKLCKSSGSSTTSHLRAPGMEKWLMPLACAQASTWKWRLIQTLGEKEFGARVRCAVIKPDRVLTTI